MTIAFKFRLYPNSEQQKLLWEHANLLNRVYNYFLNERIENQKLPKDQRLKVNRFTQDKQIPKLKKSLDFEGLDNIYSQNIQAAVKRLHNSFDFFFKKKNGFPKFRSCKKFFGLLYPQKGYYLNNSIFKTTAFGEIKFNKCREVKGNIKQVYISNKKNKFYLNITTDYENPKTTSYSEIGIDIGLTNIIVDSNGVKTKNASHSIYFDKQIEKLQSLRDKNTTKNSRRNLYLTKVINKLHDAKHRKIDDFQHKVSKTLTSKYGVIYAEDLSSKKMSESEMTGLNKRIRNSKFSQLLSFIAYKAKEFYLVNPYNTSKTCNKCGYINQSLKLSDREITCSACKSIYDRDENAAKNILCSGRALRKLKVSESIEKKRKLSASETIQEAPLL